MPIRRWYPRKTPTLQIRILDSVALQGKLSKRKAQEEFKCRYPTISDAFKVLAEDRKLIIKIDKPHSVGYTSPEIFYKLTEEGLMVLISDGRNPEEFWEIFIWFCKLNAKGITTERFQELYKSFEDKYLGYSPQTGYFFQFPFLDKVFDRWLRTNDKMVNDGTISYHSDSFKREIPISQQVLEYLAINEPSTFEQISTEINESGGLRPNYADYPKGVFEFLHPDKKNYGPAVEKVLKEYTMSDNWFNLFRDEKGEKSDSSASYINFVYHNLIIKENEKYKLSLFGLAIVLYIINYSYHYSQSNPYSCVTLPTYKIKYNRTSEEYSKYYDIMAAYYKDKLPLIFGKWNILKNAMRDSWSGSLAQIMNGIFRVDRKSLVAVPAISGGPKEYYENIQSLARHRSIKLKSIYEALKTKEDEYEVNDRLKDLFGRKLKELRDMLMFTDIDSFIDTLQEKLLECPDVTKTVIKQLEQIFANEVSYLLYLVIGRGLGMITRTIGKRFVDSLDRSDVTYDLMPTNTLIDILNRDKEIKDQFSRWINDSKAYQEEVLEIISKYESRLG